MFTELWQTLSEWGPLDTWIVVTAALAAMACALPGSFLVLRRQSMMGDAIAHAVLPGIAGAFLATHGLRAAGVISPDTYTAVWHGAMFAGAVAIGIVTAWLTETVRKLGGVESSAALGVVYTALFAAGLLMIRLAADRVHIDADCVLYGTIETVVMDTLRGTAIPRAAVVNGGMLVVNLALLLVLFKELRISAFDPALATTLGINATAMHYGLMAVTAATLVAAFESVGSILVIAMLIVPPATAYLLTRRLSTMIALSLVIAAAGAVLGHVGAITLPPLIFRPLGFATVVDASTAGSIAVAAGLLFVVAVLLSPTEGLVTRFVRQGTLSLRVACEDVLGLLYRLEEMQVAGRSDEVHALLERGRGLGVFLQWLAILRLRREGKIAAEAGGYRLTAAGQRTAQNLVRSHRLWEAYLNKHFALSAVRQHRSAHLTEHYIDPAMMDELADELEAPAEDPHGRAIPPPSDRGG